MPSYLERYQSGEREQVWSELTALGAAVRTEPLFSDAMAVARETMARARQNIELIIPRLETIGYHLESQTDGDEYFLSGYSNPITPAPATIAAHLDAVEEIIGKFPLSLRAWYETVGNVNLIGAHPNWDIDYLDPLFVVSLEHGCGLSMFDEWRDGVVDKNPPFLYLISPDCYGKAHQSGNPYSVSLPCLAADAPLDGELHETTFVNYLRICFQWGGFPGLDPRIDGVGSNQHIAYLTEGLLPL
ncbi:hypothetical protein CCAX7_18980 [Capsulimonas corticalis]|uniref:Uncharacterized protein n=1 Tax=Capsulimonas corticalis TaxID=2219043 RepID=A0A402D5A6_9BACT|nr:hypothetical protein [Capsulimonas corticalis]BDI29847.1 hypothetical protein CCAX7_18980 [Capsulimonas corticalis]